MSEKCMCCGKSEDIIYDSPYIEEETIICEGCYDRVYDFAEQAISNSRKDIVSIVFGSVKDAIDTLKEMEE